MTKKILILGVAIIMALGLFAGCGGNNGDPMPYNATFFPAGNELFSDDFVKNNWIRGAVMGLDDEGQPILADESYPITRTVIILEQDEYEQTYTYFHPDLTVDFEKDMLLLYAFNTNEENIKFQSIKMDEDALQICLQLSSQKKSGNTGIQPQQRWVAVRMDKLAITTVEFTTVKA